MKIIIHIPLYTLFLISLIFAGNSEKNGFSKSFKVSGEGTLSISLQIGEVNVNTWKKDKVKIVSNDISEDDVESVSISQEGNNIEFDYYGAYNHKGMADFKFYVPERFNVVSKTSSGDIRLTGKLDGNFNGYTSGGDIDLDEILGDLTIITAGGDIRLLSIGGNLEADTYGGDINLHDVKGEKAEIKTKGGSISMGEVEGRLTTITYGGDIRIDLAGDDSEINTYGGDIRIKETIGDIRAKTNGGDITILSGKGYLKVNTNGGDITLKKITGGVDANTNAGSVYAELIPDSKYETELRSLYGDIELRIPAKSSAKIQAKIRSTGGRGNYEIRSDFKPNSYREKSSYVQASYKIGGGKNAISISTISSDIKIKKIQTWGKK